MTCFQFRNVFACSHGVRSPVRTRVGRGPAVFGQVKNLAGNLAENGWVAVTRPFAWHPTNSRPAACQTTVSRYMNPFYIYTVRLVNHSLVASTGPPLARNSEERRE